MKPLLAVLAVALLASGPSAAGESRPADVADFIASSESCQHWRGEYPYDQDRAAKIKAAVAKACTDLPKRLAGLKKRHARDRSATALLGKFDRATGLSDEFPGN